MSESFDCPKCGAPLQYDGEKEGYKETITCPYCGESVIVPENLRTQAPQMINVGQASHAQVIELGGLDHPTVITLDTEAPAQAAQVAKRSIGGCLVVSLIIVLIMGVVAIISMNSIKDAVLSTFNTSQTNPSSETHTQIAPILAQATITPDEPPTEVPAPTDFETPTTSVNTTATAQAAATLTALNALADQQNNWPMVVQDKFVNDALNWNVGSENNQYAIEDFTIANNKYTWKFTTKKSMGSFSFPDMQTLTDMFVSVDMQMVSNSTFTDDEAGIIFHVSNKDNTFYFFGVNPNGSYWLSMYDGSNWNDMIPAATSDLLKPNQVNHLAVSIQGNEILLMINNSVVNSFEDAQLSSGGAGLGVELTSAGEDATVIFSNFYLRAPKQ